MRNHGQCEGKLLYNSFSIIQLQTFCTEHLIYTDLCFDYCIWRSFDEHLGIMDIFRTDTENNCFTYIAAIFKSFCFSSRDNQFMLANFSDKVATFFGDNSVKEVHLRRSHESCNE